MRVRDLCVVALGMIAIAAVPRGAVYAGDQYQATIVADDTNTTAFSIIKPGSKIVIKPSNNPADGGIVVQLLLKNVDCPDVGNDGGKAGKCGSKGAAPGAPTRNHALTIGVRVLGADLPDVSGVAYRLEKGAAVFEATGKNKASAAQLFGNLAGNIRGQSLGIGVVKLQEPGTDPTNAATGCGVVPLPVGNTCTDRGVYGVAGIKVP